MIKSRIIFIENKIVSSDDLRRLAEILNREKVALVHNGKHSVTRYEVMFHDYTTNKSDTTDVFSDESLHHVSRPVRVQMSFYTHGISKSIDLTLEHGSKTSKHNVYISSEDDAWFNQMVTVITEALESIPASQTNLAWFRRHRSIYTAIAAITIGFVYLTFLKAIVACVAFVLTPLLPIIQAPSWMFTYNRVVDKIPAVLLYWLTGLGYALQYRQKIEDAWPDIDLNFGPKHLRQELAEREHIKWVMNMFLIPLGLSLVLELLHAFKLIPL